MFVSKVHVRMVGGPLYSRNGFPVSLQLFVLYWDEVLILQSLQVMMPKPSQAACQHLKTGSKH